MRRPAFALACALTLGVGLVLGVPPGRAQDGTAARPELRPIADAYAEDGDLDRAVGELARLQATPGQLLSTLRSPAAPAREPVPGLHSVELADGGDGKTELLVVAPSAEKLKAAATSGRGLGLVVCLHGLGGSNRQALGVATKLAETGDVVAVAPTARRLPRGEGTDDDGIPELFKQRHWWAYDSPRSFPLEAIAKARSLYAIDPDRVSLSGMSMGGYGTWNIGLRRPDRFALLAPLAGGISRFGVRSDSDDVSKALLENGRALPVFSVHGDSDRVVPYGPDREACDRLAQLGGVVTLRTMPGVDHDLRGVYAGRGEYGDELVRVLAGARRRTSPDSVTFVALSERQDGAYWLRIAERSKRVARPRIEGKVDRAANRVVVSGQGVEKARVYLDDRLLDLSRPVTVVVGDAVRSKELAAPEFRAILESWRARRDEGLVYPAFVEVDPRLYE